MSYAIPFNHESSLLLNTFLMPAPLIRSCQIDLKVSHIYIISANKASIYDRLNNCVKRRALPILKSGPYPFFKICIPKCILPCLTLRMNHICDGPFWKWTLFIAFKVSWFFFSLQKPLHSLIFLSEQDWLNT